MNEQGFGIDWDQLVQAVDGTENEADPMALPLPPILDQALDALSEIDINTAAGLSPHEKPKRSQEMVVVVNETLHALQSSGGGLAFLTGGFLCFSGTHWAKIGTGTLKAFLLQASLKLGIRLVDAQYHRYVEDLVKQVACSTGRDQPELISGKYLMNFPNGTLEIVDGIPLFREHRKEDMITHILTSDYDPEDKCEKWQAHLERVLPDKPSQLNLAEYLGSIFTDLKLEKALVLVGDGNNGKSVVFDVVCGALGKENITNYSLESLNREYHRAGLAGFLLNYSSEIGRNPKAEILKKMVSGEPIEARLPYGNPFIMHQYARLAFNANELPMDVEHTDAFFRRLLILPFTERIRNEERNFQLAKEILKEETSGVINWIISGLLRVVEQGGFTDNPVAQKALDGYRLESDSVALFTNEVGYIPNSGSDRQIKLSDLHADYRVYCKENLYIPVASRTMAKRLKALGFQSQHKKRGLYFYVGEAEKPLF